LLPLDSATACGRADAMRPKVGSTSSLDQIFQRERLFQEDDPRTKRHILWISRHADDAQTRSQKERAPHQLLAVHPWHPDICDQEVNRVRKSLTDFECVIPVQRQPARRIRPPRSTPITSARTLPSSSTTRAVSRAEGWEASPRPGFAAPLLMQSSAFVEPAPDPRPRLTSVQS
jgi:hypothetical protein